MEALIYSVLLGILLYKKKKKKKHNAKHMCSAMDSGAGSLAIGELIGAAFFIVAVVSGCMGIIKPFQSQRVTFMRDATYLLGAALIMTWIAYNQSIHWYHGIILIVYYVSYVAVVMLGAYRNRGYNNTNMIEQKPAHEIDLVDESTCLLPNDLTTKRRKCKIGKIKICLCTKACQC